MAANNSSYPGYDFTAPPVLLASQSFTRAAVPAPAGAPDDPEVRSNAVRAMLPKWDPINVCIGGTAGLRKDARRLIPSEPREDPESYKRRIFHAVLPPFLQRLASQAAGLILRKGIQLQGDPYWEEWAQNVCGDGTTLNSFARQQLENALLYGHSSAIVDYPPIQAANLAAQRANNAKPYLIHVNPQSIRGWRTENNNPQAPLTQVRIHEIALEDVGRFGEEEVEQVRVLEKGRYELWRKEGGAGWGIYESGTTDLDRIPLVTVYGNRISTLTSAPPLLEVAYLNICYAQRWCDYMHSIHVGAMPILTMRGFDPDADSPVGISVNTAVLLPVDGGAEYIAPTTDAFDSQLKCLEALEEQISRLGINTLTRQNTTNAAAEAKRMDRIDSDSIMALISADLANAMTNMLEIAAQYVGIEPPTVVIEQDYENRLIDGNQITAMLQLFMQNAISQETLLEILQQGEVLPAGLDIQEEITRTQEYIDQQNTSMGLDPLAQNPAALDRTNEANAGQGDSIASQTLPTPMRPGRNPN
jgi:hypothetical protein